MMPRSRSSSPPLLGFDDDLEAVTNLQIRSIESRTADNHLSRTHSEPIIPTPRLDIPPPPLATPRVLRRSERERRPVSRLQLDTPVSRRLGADDRHPRFSERWITDDAFLTEIPSPQPFEWEHEGTRLISNLPFDDSLVNQHHELFSPARPSPGHRLPGLTPFSPALSPITVCTPAPPPSPSPPPILRSDAFIRAGRRQIGLPSILIQEALERFIKGRVCDSDTSTSAELSRTTESSEATVISPPAKVAAVKSLRDLSAACLEADKSRTNTLLEATVNIGKSLQSIEAGVFNLPALLNDDSASTIPAADIGTNSEAAENLPGSSVDTSASKTSADKNVTNDEAAQLYQQGQLQSPESPQPIPLHRIAPPSPGYTHPPNNSPVEDNTFQYFPYNINPPETPLLQEERRPALINLDNSMASPVMEGTRNRMEDTNTNTNSAVTNNLTVNPSINQQFAASANIMAEEVRKQRMIAKKAVAAAEDEYRDYDPSHMPITYLRGVLDKAVTYKDQLVDAICVLEDDDNMEALTARSKSAKGIIINFMNQALVVISDHEKESPPPAPDQGQRPHAQGGGGGNMSVTKKAFKERRVQTNETKIVADLDSLAGQFRTLTISATRSDNDYKVLEHQLSVVSKRSDTIFKEGSSLCTDALDADLADSADCIDRHLSSAKEAKLEAETRVSEIKSELGLFGDTAARLTELKPPTFSGDNDSGADYFTFRKDYEEYSSSKGYSLSQQLNILKKTCLSGSAKSLCADMTSIKEVLDYLKSHYGCARLLLSHKLADFKTLGSCSYSSATKKRTWLIAANQKLKAIQKLAQTHGIEQNLYHSPLLSEVRAALPFKLEEQYKQQLEDSNSNCTNHEEMFEEMIRFIDLLVARSSFEVNYELALGQRSVPERSQPKQPPTASKPSSVKKTFPALTHATSSPTAPSPKGQPKPAANKKSQPKPLIHFPAEEVNCVICKKDHKYLFQCEKYQTTALRDRIRLCRTTRACHRCLRMDSEVDLADRDSWWNKHRGNCEATWACKEQDCPDQKPYKQYHFTLCIRHPRQNKSKVENFIKSVSLKPGTSFFFNLPYVFTASPSVPSEIPRHFKNDKIHPDIEEPSIFMLQNVETNEGRNFLVFFDSGCSGAAISDYAVKHMDTQLITPGPIKMGVAGGQVVTIPGGDERFWLNLTQPGEVATLTGLNMPKITTPFPVWPLQEAFQSLEVAYTKENPDAEQLPQVPDVIGGSEVHIMVGIRYNKYFPVPKYSLPCGLTVHEAQFRTPDGRQGVLGGTHRSWRNAHHSAQLLCPQIFFTAELRAYRAECSTLRHLYKEIEHQDVDDGLVDLLNYEENITVDDVIGPRDHIASNDGHVEEAPKIVEQPVDSSAAGHLLYRSNFNNSEEKKSKCPFVHCKKHCSEDWIVPASWDASQNIFSSKQDLDKFESIDSLGSEVSYRCLRCRNCSDCRKGDLLEAGSLEGEVEQALMEKCVELNLDERRLEASLPFTLDPTVHLAPNRHRALKVLQSQLNKVKKNPEFREDIFAAHNKLLEKGHVSTYEDLTPEEKKIVDATKKNVNHIPWSIVRKVSTSTPCRMVYNASSKTATGQSLNSVLAKGENRLPKIFDTLIKFGSKKCGFTCDVSMAYNQIKLKPHHYNYQRYLWQPDLNPDVNPLEMFIKTLIYGVVCAGGMCAIAFALVAMFCREHHPEHVAGAEALESAYVDDAAYPTDTLEEAHAAARSMDFVLDIASMKVKAYTFAGEPPDEKVSSDGKSVGLLGYTWWSQSDKVSLAVKELFFGKVVRGKLPPPVEGDVSTALAENFTRRTIVAKFASIFDPMGYCTPVTGRIKLDMCQITDLKLGWDDPLPQSLLEVWVSNLNDLQSLRNLQFNRSFIHPLAVSNKVELLVQVDASETIAMAVVHARTELPNGSFAARFVAAKSKLVHLNTVPKGELKGAVLGASLAHVVRRSLGDRHIRTIFVTDSTIVLYWLNQDSRPLQTSVRNSVIEIRRLTDLKNWYHIDSKNNLADIGTRQAVISDLAAGTDWQEGNWWMKLPFSRMPLLSLNDVTLSQAERQDANKEIKASDLCGVCLPSLTTKVSERYSFSEYLVDPNVFPWKKSVRTLAYVFKFIEKMRNVKKKMKNDIVKGTNDPAPTPSGPVTRAKRRLIIDFFSENVKKKSKRAEKSSIPRPAVLEVSNESPKQAQVSSPDQSRKVPGPPDIPTPPPAPPCTLSKIPLPLKKSEKKSHDSSELCLKSAQSPKTGSNDVCNFFQPKIPSEYSYSPVPDIVECDGLRPAPPEPCEKCVFPSQDPEITPIYLGKLISSRRPGLRPPPSASPPPPPPEAPPPSTAPTSSPPPPSPLRPDADEFRPGYPNVKFPKLSRKLMDALDDFQLSTEEIERAERYFFLKGTREVKQFSKHQDYKNCSSMKDGILTFEGRILDGQLITDVENIMEDLEPLSFCKPVLDRYSPVAYSVMIHSHKHLSHHRNSVCTLRESRNLAYILKGRDLANEIRDNCEYCKRFKARLIQTEMGKQHSSRLTVSPCFYQAQVDLCGPFLARCEHKPHRANVAVYGAVFKDPSSGAIAVYAMPGKTTGAFLNCYTRHSSRYGHAHKLFIDAGGELMKACREMEVSWTDITTTLNANFGVGIEHVVVNTAAHNAHGIVERSILEVKRLFKVLFSGLKLDLYGYETAFAYIANELNSMPLCLGSKYENLEHTDLITPSRLMLGRNNRRSPTGYPRIQSKSSQIAQLDEVHRAWWKTWKNEKLEDYIPAPRKWHGNTRPPIVGDIVIFIQDECALGESHWRLGRITRLITSAANGLIYSAIIEYKNASEDHFRDTKRSVRKFAILHREGELGLMDTLNEAAKIADINLEVQLAHDTVHRRRFLEFFNIPSPSDYMKGQSGSSKNPWFMYT